MTDPEPPARPNAPTELTAGERHLLGCDCWRLNGEWQHDDRCPVETVERILAARQAPTVLDRVTVARAILMVTQDPSVSVDYAWSVQYPEVQDELLAQADAVLALLPYATLESLAPTVTCPQGASHGPDGIIPCWSPGGPCPAPNVAGCESCGPCVQCTPEATATTPTVGLDVGVVLSAHHPNGKRGWPMACTCGEPYFDFREHLATAIMAADPRQTVAEVEAEALREAARSMRACKETGHWNLRDPRDPEASYSPDRFLEVLADRIGGK